MRESVRKSPSKVGEVLSPDIAFGAPENGRHFTFASMGRWARNSLLLFRCRPAHFVIHFQRTQLVKSLTEHIWFEVPNRRGFINITPKIEELVQRSGVIEGLCLVNAMHITASVFINDDEPGLHHDYEVWLEKLAPHAPTNAYRHNRTGEDNADAHLKRQIMGREVVVAITKGKLDFGPWEQIFYGEFDGKRRKRVLIKIIGE
jgi:secondary thiamine-phosphate synthase enzyme